MIETTVPPKSRVEPAKSGTRLVVAGSSRPLYVELADSLQSLVEQGTLRPGHRVPSVRIMSRQRDVSIATVLQAYTVLENRGYLEARPQSGYYVRPRPPNLARYQASSLGASLDPENLQCAANTLIDGMR